MVKSRLGLKCGRSIVVMRQPSKLVRWVRFPSPAHPAGGEIRSTNAKIRNLRASIFECRVSARRVERYRSGQTGQTVNLLAYAFSGSNPLLSTRSPARSYAGFSLGGKSGPFRPDAGISFWRHRCCLGCRLERLHLVRRRLREAHWGCRRV